MAQVFNGVFEAFLSLTLLGVLVSLCLFHRGLGLGLRGVLHRLGAPIGDHGLQGQQDTAHADPQKGQGFCFCLISLEFGRHIFQQIVGEHDGYENRQ